MSEERVNPKYQQGLESFGAFVREFASESDRAAVVLGVAKLDSQLYQLIAKALLPSTSTTDELLDGDSPLSTFSAKIQLAYRLGLIDSALARALHLCRRIRNTFAHEVSSSSLDGQRDRVRELTNLFSSVTEQYHQFRRNVFGDVAGIAADFRCALAIISVRLDSAILEAGPPSPTKAVSLIPPWF